MRVLLIGDSHTVGAYGRTLESLFKDAGAQVVRVANVGAVVGHYLPGAKYDAQLPVGQAFDLLVVTLGTNDAANIEGVPPPRFVERVQQLASRFNARDVWYVGPPAFSENAAATYNRVLFAKENLNSRSDKLFRAAQATFGNRAIDPRAATAPFVHPTDIHLPTAGGRAWAQFVFDRIRATPASGGNAAGGFPWLGVLLGLGLALWWRRRRP